MSLFQVAVPPVSPPGSPSQSRPVSPLVLADRLITLAQDADRAGYRQQAEHLVAMVYSVLDATGAGLPASGRGRRVRASGPATKLALSAARPVRGLQPLPA